MTIKQRLLQVVQDLDDDASYEDIQRAIKREHVAIQKEEGTYESLGQRLRNQIKDAEELRERLRNSDHSFEVVQQGPGHRTLVVKGDKDNE